MTTKAQPKLAIITAEYHADISKAMVEAAVSEAQKHGQTIKDIFTVPGSYEIPLLAQHLLRQKKFAALIVLAYIEKGETLHGEIMGHVVHTTLINLQLEHNTPIGLGIIGPGATLEQAQARQNSSARAAVNAALQSLALIYG